MIDFNKLRRLAQAATPGPDGVSLSWIKLLQDFQQGANPAAINELLDRLEAAEKSRDDLLDELLSILDWAVTERAPLRNQEIKSIRAAIAKATGEQP